MLNRRHALAAESAEGGGESSSAHWPNGVFTAEHGATTHESFGDVTVYHEARTNDLRTMVTGTVILKPGQEPHPPHQHPEEEFMFVSEGSGEIYVNGTTTAVTVGALMYCEGNALHGIKNTGTGPMRFFYCKWAA